MKVTNIQLTPKDSGEIISYNSEIAEKTASVQQSQPAEEVSERKEWQLDILLDALDRLENNIQLDDNEQSSNHPLSVKNFYPIESLEEAMIEISYIKSPFFKSNALEAQANIDAKDVASLFV
jgi:hypothetical protein